MGVITPILGTILALGWLGTLAIPGAWHYAPGLVNIYVGVFSFKLQKSMVAQGVQVGAQFLGDKIGKADLGDKVDQFMDEGSYWIWEARDKYCAQDVLGQMAQEFIPFFKEQCAMWTRISIASYAIVACFVVGSSLLSLGSFLSKNKANLTRATATLRTVGLIFGPLHGILGVCIYFFMTMDFPGDKRDRFTFGGAFWTAVAFAIMSFLPLSISAMCEPDKVPDFSASAKGKAYTEQDQLMQGQQGSKGDYMAIGINIQQHPPGQGLPNSQLPNQQWQPAGSPPMQPYSSGRPMQQIGSPENTEIPQEAWEVIARAAGTPWIAPPLSPRGSPQFPNSAPPAMHLQTPTSMGAAKDNAKGNTRGQGTPEKRADGCWVLLDHSRHYRGDVFHIHQEEDSILSAWRRASPTFVQVRVQVDIEDC